MLSKYIYIYIHDYGKYTLWNVFRIIIILMNILWKQRGNQLFCRFNFFYYDFFFLPKWVILFFRYIIILSAFNNGFPIVRRVHTKKDTLDIIKKFFFSFWYLLVIGTSFSPSFGEQPTFLRKRNPTRLTCNVNTSIYIYMCSFFFSYLNKFIFKRENPFFLYNINYTHRKRPNERIIIIYIYIFF